MDHFDEILAPHGVTEQAVKDFFANATSTAPMTTGHYALRTSGTSGQITCIVLDEEDARRMLASSMVFGTILVTAGTMLKALLGRRLKVASIILVGGHFPGAFYSHLMKRFVGLMKIIANSKIVDIAQPIDDIIATDCSQHRLHHRPEVSILENVDENNYPVAPGEVGHHVLVTNLNAYTLPIIRFVLDDRLAVSPLYSP